VSVQVISSNDARLEALKIMKLYGREVKNADTICNMMLEVMKLYSDATSKETLNEISAIQ
jgi:hypothetical protein